MISKHEKADISISTRSGYIFKRSTEMSGWISNYIHSFLCNVISDPCSKFNSGLVEVGFGSVIAGSDTMRLFADDTVLFMHDPNLNNLINDKTEKFTELYNWCVCNKLTINGEKTNFVLFHAINKPVPQNFDHIKTGVMDVTRVKTFQYQWPLLLTWFNFNLSMDK